MITFLKRWKGTYSVYNLFHRKALLHNEVLFRKWGLHKKYYSSLSSKDFIGFSGDSIPAETDRSALENCSLFRSSNNIVRESLLSFSENGFAIINGYLSSEQADAVNAEMVRLLETKKVRFNRKQKIMFAIRSSKLLRGIGNDAALKELLSALLKGRAVLFQSINFLMGSEQSTHSDSIHMTTYPPGGLLGIWIALEDITNENGPLHYYPGSHKLPYYLNADYDNAGSRSFLGKKSYTDYEQMISEKIMEQQLEKVIFLARKGDLLIWHANLFHGGEPHLNKNKTRKSMVLHYFNEEAICYHEITQRPALIKKYF